jgi:Cu/Ag efflux protein CusF
MFFLGLALTTFTTAGVAFAQDEAMPSKDQKDQAMPSKKMTQKTSVSATVEKVDVKKRELSLKDEQGNSFMVEVPEDVTRLDAIKKGDKINLDYIESMTLSLKRPEKGEMPTSSEAKMSERAPGPLPGGSMGRTITATAMVTKIDVANNKVTIKGPEGKMDTINVSDPSLQPELSKLKKGDRIQATYTEAMAISVTPKNKE